MRVFTVASNIKDQLFAVIDNLSAQVICIDVNYNILYVNKSQLPIFGISRQEMVGKNLWVIAPKAIGTIIETKLKEAVETGKIVTFEWIGAYSGRILETSLHPSHLGVTIVSSDVTERKNAENSVKRYSQIQEGTKKIFQEALSTRSEERLGALCLSVAQSVTQAKFGFIGEFDKQGTFHDIAMSSNTKEACKIYDKQTGHRRPPFDFKVQGIYGRVLIQGKGFFTNDPSSQPDSVGVPTGHPPLESFLGVPLISKRKTVGMIGLANRKGGFSQNDLEAIEALSPAVVEAFLRKRSEQKLENYKDNLERLVEERTKQVIESEQRYHELYDSFGEAFIAMDWELNIIHWNKAAERVTTVKAKEALGKKIYEVLPEFLTIDVTPYLETLKEQKPARFMMNVKSRETKKPSIFEISSYPSKQGIIIIVEDKTLEEQTKRLSAIGATAGMVGHDIRNPLQAMISNLFLMKEELASSEFKCKNEIMENLEDFEQNINYINKIVQDLQDYARPIMPQYTDVDFSEVLANVFQNLKVPDSINVTIRTGDLQSLRADGTLLQRVLSNFVANAIQAMPNGGSLKIEGRWQGSSAVVTVSDTGVGIPDEVKPKLFTPMMTTKSKGQGFGLAVSKRLVEAMKGTISFESEVNKGTKFIIELPS